MQSIVTNQHQGRGTVYEKGPYEENICFLKNIYFFKKHMFFGTYIFAEKHIFFVRPLLEDGVHACARLSRLSFRALLTSG